MTQQDALLFALREDAARDEVHRAASGPFAFASVANPQSGSAELPAQWPETPAPVASPAAAAVDTAQAVPSRATLEMQGAEPPVPADPTPSVMQMPSAAVDPGVLIGLQRREDMLRRLLLILVVLMLMAGSWASFRSGAAAGNLAAADRLAMLSQRIGKAVQRVVVGQPAAVSELRNARAVFGALVDALVQGGEADQISTTATSGAALAPLGAVKDAWTKADARLGTILAQAGQAAPAAGASAVAELDGLVRTVIDEDTAALLAGAEALAGSYRDEAGAARLWLLAVVLLLFGAVARRCRRRAGERRGLARPVVAAARAPAGPGADRCASGCRASRPRGAVSRCPHLSLDGGPARGAVPVRTGRLGP
jgi:hypothetical protein